MVYLDLNFNEPHFKNYINIGDYGILCTAVNHIMVLEYKQIGH